MKIKVMVVDDSAFMRQVISNMINEDPELEIVGIARDGEDAIQKIPIFKPDVITLDVEMPKMDGISFLKKVMTDSPLPIIMVSYLTREGAEPTLKALELGAVDFVTKPSNTNPASLRNVQTELTEKIKAAAKLKSFKVRELPLVRKSTPVDKDLSLAGAKLKKESVRVVVFGTSTGGPRALYHILPMIPKDFPVGIIVAQHMPKGFTAALAKRLNEVCNLEVSEARNGDLVRPGKILVAPAGYQTRIVEREQYLYVEVFERQDQIYKPSIDLLFNSVAEVCKNRALCVLMTGMGADGANGLKKLRDMGSTTIAEAEESCVVFGMPRAAIQLNAADYVESLPNIYSRIAKNMME